MPNGGTDNCMNCSHNRANSSLQDIKAGDRHSRIPFCMLRTVPVYDRAWTYCRNFTHKRPEAAEPIGPIFANGQWGPGYVRIPWYDFSEPSLREVTSCAVCSEPNEKGISIVLSDGRLIEFCTNEHYMDWVEKNPPEDKTDPTLKKFIDDIIGSDEVLRSNALNDLENINACDDYRRTALHWSAYSGSASILEMLINDGADINFIDRNQWTALHYASYFGHEECTEVLLRAKADPLKKDRVGMQPIDLAGSEGYTQIVSDLIEVSYASDEKREEALFSASDKGNLSLVEALVGAGVNIDCTDEADWTPFLKAVYGGNVTISVYLLDQGANVNAKNKYGYSAYSITHTWKTSGMEELREFVLSHGAKE